MDRMGQFKKYFLVFGSLFIILFFLTELATRAPRRELEYSILFESPKLTITEVELLNNRVNIEGEITNDTGEFIHVVYLRFEFYNERGVLLGTDYEQLRLFNMGETMRIDTNHRYRNIYSVRISLADESS